ncbi:MAG: hypothetical protein ACI8R4_001494 [Paracoccaceae bacterium]|jgi:hypothetical protein
MVRLDTGEGATGLISRYNQQRQHWRLEVENLSDQDWDVRTLDRVPYSEQDDLKISWAATPQPNETNVDDRRGILGWDLTLAAGKKQTIDIHTELTWPDGKELR